MNSPKFFLVDIVLAAAGTAAAMSEQGLRAQQCGHCCGVEIVSTEPGRMILIVEGEALPSAAEVRSAIAELVEEEAAVAIGTEECGWEVLFLPPQERPD